MRINNNRKSTRGRKFYNKPINKLLSIAVVPQYDSEETYDREKKCRKSDILVLPTLKEFRKAVNIAGATIENMLDYYMDRAIDLQQLKRVPHRWSIIPKWSNTTLRINCN